MLTLAADDEPTQRLLLKRALTSWGHEVVMAKDGRAAWEALCAERVPRIAILDWNMPGFNGIDVCRKLKAVSDGPYVYTILITHEGDDNAAQTALDSGADDFLRKPLNFKELRSRLGVGIRVINYDEGLKRKNLELEQYASHLEELARERAKQLAHADRMATLGVLAAGVAHEVNNPATFISGNAQTLQRFWEDTVPWLTQAAESADDKSQRKLSFIQEEFPKALAGIQSGVKRISKIVKGLKAYSGQTSMEKSSCDINQSIQLAMELCKHELNSHGASVECALEKLPTIYADSQQLEQVFVNLLVNASHAMAKCEQRVVTVRTSSSSERVSVFVQDTGTGIPASALSRIFEPFFTTKEAGKGTGLGLPICRDIIADHAGTLSVENMPDGGAQFHIELPISEGPVL